MTSTAAVLIVFSLVQFFAGNLVYARNTFLGRSQPNRVTFFLWTVVPLIAFCAGLSQGWSWALLPVFMSGFGPFVVFIASFTNERAYWKLGAFDYLCGAMAVVALVMWYATKDPAVAIFFSILSDFFAGLPTLIKAWRHPETETSAGYLTAVLNECAGLAILPAFTFVNAGFLTYLIAMNASILSGILRTDPWKRLRSDFVRRRDI